MPSVGQIEKKTQERVLALLSQRLGYTYLGDWIDRPANSNIEPERLKAWLAAQGVSDTLAVGADSILSHRADSILSQGWKPTSRSSAVDKCRSLPGSLTSS
ncbi:MAG: hypothetical protein J0L57_09635, partial [Burkholderiales bacterium]|nr:hypothetical protein [Burkholderiales bacterium]